jgi:hypothetical protein
MQRQGGAMKKVANILPEQQTHPRAAQAAKVVMGFRAVNLSLNRYSSTVRNWKNERG